MNVSHVRKAAAHAAVDELVRAALHRAGRRRGAPTRVALERLLRQVRGRTALLRPPINRPRGVPDGTAAIVSGLLSLATYFKVWIRPPEAWAPAELNPRPLFASLTDHLFAHYPVPAFLTSAWLRGQGVLAHRFQRSFIHLGRGGSLRNAGFPVPLSRAMAHALSHAPAHLPVEHALRWAQVVALGGGDALVAAVNRSRLGSAFQSEPFWLTVLHFFVNQRPLDPADVVLLIDYIHDQKFYCERVIVGEATEINLPPPQPDFTMKGRTLPSLLRRAVAWREEQQRPRPARRRVAWAPASIGGYDTEDEQGRAWTIRQLLDSDELTREGKAMHHCVADYYTESCARRETTIWSLGVATQGGRERALTIEVNPTTRVIVQASMHGNAEPDEWCRAVLLRWGAQEGLAVDCLAEEPELVP